MDDDKGNMAPPPRILSKGFKINVRGVSNSFKSRG
jgi:hypothetical protein